MSNQQKVDTVFLRKLQVETTIGFFDWERHVKQTVEIDLEFPVDCARAAASDSVKDTTDYKSIAKRTIQFVTEAQFHLVETLAHRLAMTLLDEYKLEWVKLEINKPGAIRGSKDVGVSIERHRT